MDGHMSLHGRYARKQLRTQFALKSLLARMRHLMQSHRVASRKQFRTQFTLERSLARMRSHVRLQILLVQKFTTTKFAFARRFAHVRFHVHHYVLFARIVFLANVTRERSFARVRPQVRFKFEFAIEATAAHFTVQHIVLAVLATMPHQTRQRRKLLLTLVTFVHRRNSRVPFDVLLQIVEAPVRLRTLFALEWSPIFVRGPMNAQIVTDRKAFTAKVTHVRLMRCVYHEIVLLQRTAVKVNFRTTITFVNEFTVFVTGWSQRWWRSAIVVFVFIVVG